MIQVALCPSEIRRISAMDLGGVTAVVFDVLRATSSIVTGLASGVEAIIPVRTVEEARELKLKDSDLLLAGERNGLPPEGFNLGNSPEEFEQIKGRRVVMTTTNGTVAIQSMSAAAKVLIGSMLNVDALADYLFRHQPKSLLLVCAIGAGALVARLPDGEGLSDSAIFVRSLYERVGDDVLEWLRQTKNGKLLQKIGKDADIRRCAQLSVFDVVGHLKGGSIIRH